MVKSERLKTEFDYYVNHQDELVAKYNGKYIVIVGESVVGVYDTLLEGYFEAQKSHRLGEFMLHLCGPGKENYTRIVNRAIL